MYGRGVDQDYTEAIKWFAKSAELGDARAMNNLGIMFMYGRGVKQDYTEAIKWFAKSAELGDSDAMYCLGLMYHDGLGVKQDYTEAIKWYEEAVKAGNKYAVAPLEELKKLTEESKNIDAKVKAKPKGAVKEVKKSKF